MRMVSFNRGGHWHTCTDPKRLCMLHFMTYGWRGGVISLKDQLPWILGGKPHIKASLLVRFIEGHGEKTNKLTMLVRFSSFPHELELLEGNIFHDKDEPLNNEITIKGK